MSVLHENSEYYENKYLKYKAKYLELKQIIGGKSAATVRRANNNTVDDIKKKMREINEILKKNLEVSENVIIIHDGLFQPPTNYNKTTFLKYLLTILNDIGKFLQEKKFTNSTKFTSDQKTKLNNILKSQKVYLSELISLKELINTFTGPAVTQPVSPRGSTSSGKSSGSLFKGFGTAVGDIFNTLTRRL
jgi:hypothetical protein